MHTLQHDLCVFCLNVFILYAVRNDNDCIVNKFRFFSFQVSNGPINSTITSISSSVQSNLVKSTPSTTAKVPVTSASTSPGKQSQQSVQSPSQPVQLTSSPPPHQQTQQSSPQTTKSSAPASNYVQPLTTLANGFTVSTSSISSTHSISTPLITTPISNQSTITNGTSTTSLTAIAQTPPSLPIGLPHPPTATAPSAVAPSAHSNLDSSSARTNSPAVATSAAPPAANGNVSTNGALGPYRSGYPGYPLYAPYNTFHHSSPYIPPAVSSPSASPRPVESRQSRESPLVNSKGLRPITPNAINNSQQPPIGASQATNLREQSQSAHLAHTSLSLQKAHSPRGHSPTRERDSYR